MSAQNDDENAVHDVVRADELFWFYAFLGSLFSALALISLAQKVFIVGLAPAMQGIVDNYRNVVHPVMHFMLGWVQAIWPMPVIPEWMKDTYAVSFVGGAAMARANYLIAVRSKADDRIARRLTAVVAALVKGAIFGATLLGLAAIVWSVFGAIVFLLTGGRIRIGLPSFSRTRMPPRRRDNDDSVIARVMRGIRESREREEERRRQALARVAASVEREILRARLIFGLILLSTAEAIAFFIVNWRM